MEININSLIAYDALRTDIDSVFSVVEKNGEAILLKDNKPAYIIRKFDEGKFAEKIAKTVEKPERTLHEAMKIVLSEAKDKTMHAAKLADEIYERGLYWQRNGNKAQSTQIRTRCGHYEDMFDALPGNYIKLKENKK